MQIVDAQIHLWGTGLPSNKSHIQVTSFTAEEAIDLMNKAGVNAAVIHPPSWDPHSTEMAFSAVKKFPGRFAIMGYLPLDQMESRDRVSDLKKVGMLEEGRRKEQWVWEGKAVYVIHAALFRDKANFKTKQ